MPKHSKIAFTKRGQGQTLILLHGYGGSVLHWHKVADSLDTEFEVVLPNLSHLYIGKEQFSFSDQVDILAEWVQVHFAGKKVNLAGISYGGALAWALSLKHAELVNTVTLINPMPVTPIQKFNIPIIKQVLRMPLNMRSLYLILRTPLGRFFLKRLSQVFRVERADFWDRVDDLHGRKLLFVCHVILRFAWILKNEDWGYWENQLKTQWKKPCEFMFDPEDALFSSRTYTHFAELLKIKEHHELLDAGHLAIHSQPVEVAEIMRKFLTTSMGLKSA